MLGASFVTYPILDLVCWFVVGVSVGVEMLVVKRIVRPVNRQSRVVLLAFFWGQVSGWFGQLTFLTALIANGKGTNGLGLLVLFLLQGCLDYLVLRVSAAIVRVPLSARRAVTATVVGRVAVLGAICGLAGLFWLFLGPR